MSCCGLAAVPLFECLYTVCLEEEEEQGEQGKDGEEEGREGREGGKGGREGEGKGKETVDLS